MSVFCRRNITTANLGGGRVEILYVTQSQPKSTGNGGHHRAYQILHDCMAAVGNENITVFSLAKRSMSEGSYGQSPKHQGRVLNGPQNREWVTKLRIGARMLWRNPLKPAGSLYFSPVRFGNPDVLRAYRNHVESSNTPKICLVEHAGMDDFVEFNRTRGVPTVALPQNLESLHEGRYRFQRPLSVACRLVDFGQELAVLKRCEARMCISQIETAILDVLVGDSTFYPYRPVGEIKSKFQGIWNRRRKLRGHLDRDRPFLLMLGSAAHAPTGEGMRWVLKHIQDGGARFPADLVVVGSGTDLLSQEYRLPSTVSVRGWVSEEDLEDLLVRTRAVLLPSFTGLGALTRVAELRTAGIPAIASRHSTYAVDRLGKVWRVSRRWEEWLDAALAAVCEPQTAPEETPADDEPGGDQILASELRRLHPSSW